MTSSAPKRVWILAALACLILAQVHVWTEFDPCLWSPGQKHRAPSPDKSHGCQSCIPGAWTLPGTVGDLSFIPAAARLELDAPQLASVLRPSESSSPRAPPQ